MNQNNPKNVIFCLFLYPTKNINIFDPTCFSYILCIDKRRAINAEKFMMNFVKKIFCQKLGQKSPKYSPKWPFLIILKSVLCFLFNRVHGCRGSWILKSNGNWKFTFCWNQIKWSQIGSKMTLISFYQKRNITIVFLTSV